MIRYKQKEYGLIDGIRNIGTGLGIAGRGLIRGAATAGGGLLAGTVPATVGAGQVASSALGAGAGLLGKAAAWGAAHPLLLGGLGALALYKILKRRRQRKAEERGYSVVERYFSDVEYRKRVRRVGSRRLKNGFETYSNESIVEEKKYSEEFIDPNEPYIPSGPREIVPKKIVKKAEKSGVVQKDKEGNWRIINMHGPDGKAVYWKPVYKSKESASSALRSFEMGKWKKKK